jgi:RNA polymerase sigma-70 factor (ECF subfamily)
VAPLRLFRAIVLFRGGNAGVDQRRSGSGKEWVTIVEEIKKLVIRAQAGDQTAYGELVRQFQPTVYAVALSRLRNPAEAEELTQTVFVRVMDKLTQLRDAQCFAGWLRKITEHLAINRLTRGGRVHGGEQEMLDNVAGADDGPLAEIVRAEQRAEVWDGLRRMKPLDRDTLVAFYIRGQSLVQMSNAFETPIGTIKRRLHVARNRLRQQLERRTKPKPGTQLKHGPRELAVCR